MDSVAEVAAAVHREAVEPRLLRQRHPSLVRYLARGPICAYPKVARYNGSGDNTKAENYKCVAAPKARFNPPAPEYLVNLGAFGH